MRYLNFYYSPWDSLNTRALFLNQSDTPGNRPMVRQPVHGGISDDPDEKRGVLGVVFDTSTTPPTIVSGSPWGLVHPELPETFIHWNGDIVRRSDGVTVMART